MWKSDGFRTAFWKQIIEVARNFITAENSENLIELADTKEKKRKEILRFIEVIQMAKFCSTYANTLNFASLCCLE